MLASLLFGLFHPISLTYMVIAAILGLYLGMVLILGGNLLTVMRRPRPLRLRRPGYLLHVRPFLDGQE